MQDYYDIIYLAPHLDDAVLSCGGQMYTQSQAGQRQLVVTVMAGDPPPQVSDYAQSLHDRWELPLDATAGRRREDVAACALLGAETLHWPLPDCIYRLDPATGAALYRSDAALFGPLHPADEPLVETTANLLATLPAHGCLVAPLTVGQHVDHQIVRRAALHYGGTTLLFYEDYPYVQTPTSLDFLRSSDVDVWKSTVIPLAGEALSAKIEAILAYRSQLSTFFNDRADLTRQVTGYARQIGGERLWQRRPTQAPVPPPPG